MVLIVSRIKMNEMAKEGYEKFYDDNRWVDVAINPMNIERDMWFKVATAMLKVVRRYESDGRK